MAGSVDTVDSLFVDACFAVPSVTLPPPTSWQIPYHREEQRERLPRVVADLKLAVLERGRCCDADDMEGRLEAQLEYDVETKKFGYMELDTPCTARHVCDWATGTNACDGFDKANVPSAGLRCLKMQQTTPERVRQAVEGDNTVSGAGAGSGSWSGSGSGSWSGSGSGSWSGILDDTEGEESFELVPDGLEDTRFERSNGDDDEERLEAMDDDL